MTFPPFAPIYMRIWPSLQLLPLWQAGLDALGAQIKRDEEEARALLAGVAPISALDGRLCFP